MRFADYGPTIRVSGGIRAQSTRGAIGESWWSRRFLAVLESFALGSRLTRGRSYARKGQVLSLDIVPGEVSSTVQGSRPTPYVVSIGLAPVAESTWDRIEAALAAQAIFTARLLAGEMPAEIEQVFTDVRAPLFPTSAGQLHMECSCPDWSVPCKHIAATFYLLAEAFDADPFQLLLWRGRGRETLLEHLRSLRDGALPGVPATRPARAPRRAKRPIEPQPAGTAGALTGLGSPPLGETVERFWVAPVPLPGRPPTLQTEPDLLLRQLPTPPVEIGGAELVRRLKTLYTGLTPQPRDPD
jgi:uncharacterized Zn finger protein